jgi:hypothetical protein
MVGLVSWCLGTGMRWPTGKRMVRHSSVGTARDRGEREGGCWFRGEGGDYGIVKELVFTGAHIILHSWDFKGTVAWDFLSKVISPKVPNWSSDSRSKAVSNIDSNLPRYSTSKAFPRYGPLRRIFLCAMGHYGEFGCALWATAADLVIRYGPLWRIWLCAMGYCAEWSHTVKICIDFCAMGHSAGFDYALWAIAQGWLSAMGHSERFD